MNTVPMTGRLLSFCQRHSTVIIVAVGLLLTAYVVARAHLLSFTYDESATVRVFVGQDYLTILTEAETAANHMMSTATAKLSSSLLGASEFAYRLPSIIAFLLFLLFGVALLRRLSHGNGAVLVAGVFLLCCNPYQLDFFSLCRGYGFAMAFTVVTLYYWSLHMETRSNRHLFLSLVMAVLAVVSNFSLLNLYLGICALYLLTQLMRMASGGWRWSRIDTEGVSIMTAVSALLYSWARAPIGQLVRSGELFFGGTDGIWQDTVMSLVLKSTYSDSPSVFGAWLATGVLLWLAAVALFLMAGSVRGDLRNGRLSVSTAIVLLPLVILIGIDLQHRLLGTLYLIERTALFLVPMTVVAFISAVGSSSLPGSRKAVITGIPAIIMLFHTLFALNLTHTLDWHYDRDTKRMMRQLRDETPSRAVHMAVNWPNTESVFFYRRLYAMDWLKLTENPDTSPLRGTDSDIEAFYRTRPDIAYVEEPHLALFSAEPASVELFARNRVLARFPSRDRNSRTEHADFVTRRTIAVDGSEFVGFISDSAGRFLPLTGEVDFKVSVRIETDDRIASGDLHLVATIGTDVYQSATFDPRDSGSRHLTLNLYVRERPLQDSDHLKVYLWNSRFRRFTVTDFEMTVFEAI